MRIAIMGSGGVGAYVGSWLQAAGEEVHSLARGPHLAAMQTQRLRIESMDMPYWRQRFAGAKRLLGTPLVKAQYQVNN